MVDKILEVDSDRISQCHSEIIEIIRKYKPTIGELILLYGNLGYTLGASIEGYKGTGPSIEKLKQLYYTNPTVGISLMLNGVTVTTWFDTYSQKTIQQQEKQKEETK